MNADVNAWVIDSVPFNTKLYVIYVDSPTPGANPNGRLPMMMMMMMMMMIVMMIMV